MIEWTETTTAPVEVERTVKADYRGIEVSIATRLTYCAVSLRFDFAGEHCSSYRIVSGQGRLEEAKTKAIAAADRIADALAPREVTHSLSCCSRFATDAVTGEPICNCGAERIVTHDEPGVYASHRTDESPTYRAAMADAGRGHLVR